MSDAEPSFGRSWSYRFSMPGGAEIETREFNGDDTAETFAVELSQSHESPVVIHRLRGTVDWEYVTEADARR